MGDQIIKFIKDGSGDIRHTQDVDFSLTGDYQNLRVFAKVRVDETSEINHNLNFYPAFDAYSVKDGNYYLNYMGANGFKGGLNPHNVPFGEVSTGINTLYATPGFNGELAIIIYANPLYPAMGQNYNYGDDVGIRLADKGFPLGMGIGTESVNTHFQMPLIVDRGSISVTVPEIVAPAMSGEFITDGAEATKPNPLGRAVHVIADNYFTRFAGWDSLRPENPWMNPTFTDESSLTMWISDNEIGLNVQTQLRNFSITNDYVKPATEYTVDYILTNVKLP